MSAVHEINDYKLLDRFSTTNTYAVAFDGAVTAVTGTEPVAGDILTGQTNGYTHRVLAVYITSGTWAGTDAAGTIFMSNSTGDYLNGEVVDASSGATFAASGASAATNNMHNSIVEDGQSDFEIWRAVETGTNSYVRDGSGLYISTGLAAGNYITNVLSTSVSKGDNLTARAEIKFGHATSRVEFHFRMPNVDVIYTDSTFNSVQCTIQRHTTGVRCKTIANVAGVQTIIEDNTVFVAIGDEPSDIATAFYPVEISCIDNTVTYNYYGYSHSVDISGGTFGSSEGYFGISGNKVETQFRNIRIW